MSYWIDKDPVKASLYDMYAVQGADDSIVVASLIEPTAPPAPPAPTAPSAPSAPSATTSSSSPQTTPSVPSTLLTPPSSSSSVLPASATVVATNETTKEAETKPYLHQFPEKGITHFVVGPRSVRILCPYCHAELMTKLKLTNTTRTHLMAVLLGLTCLCCIPYFKKSFKNVNHYCSCCGAYLGTYMN